MDSDFGSDDSHISATPPRNPNPNSNPPLILKSKPKPSITSKSKPISKHKSNPKSADPSPPASSTENTIRFPSYDLSNPHGISVVKIQHQNSTAGAGASFSRLVKLRRPTFDPVEFVIDEKIQSCDVIEGSTARGAAVGKDRTKPKIVHPNWIGHEKLVEEPKRMKFSSEGNFVRLNINGYGRKYAFKGKKRFSASSSSRYGGSRFRQRWGKGNEARRGGGDNWEEEGLVLDAECRNTKSSGVNSKLVDEAVEAVREDPSDENLGNLLKLTHGYGSFREGQLEVIKRVIAEESAMLVLPTGGGKSLCYELPALVLPALTIVVSPLVALMVDQLRKLPSVIPGGLLSSSQTWEESNDVLHRLHEGNIKVLFISPERFLNPEFLSLLRDGVSVSLVVIDEAHCISEWSHNFRPSYLRLRASVLQNELNVQSILAMTATATTQTLQDIMDSLQIPPSNLVKACQIRENLQLFVSLSNNRLKDLLVLVKSCPFVDMKSIIIYCKFQLEAESVSKFLCDNGIPAKAYHSAMPAKYRSRIQELFCSNKIRVVVATVAFGMGLDKSDVNAVIHYSLPESLEEYIQETGRAGRDGSLSCCHLFLDDTTFYKIRSLAYSDGVDEYAVNKFLSHIFSSDDKLGGHICSLIRESISRKFDMKEEVLLTILTQLEMGQNPYLIILPQVNVTCSLYFHKTAPDLLLKKEISVASILKKSEVKGGHYVFDIPTVANDMGTSTSDVINLLQNLKSLGEVTYDLKDPAFCFIVLKKPDDICSLSSTLTEKLNQVESCKVQKIDMMFHVANSAVKECKGVDGCSGSLHTPCIQRKISNYFAGMLNESDYDLSNMIGRNSSFLRADIKVFLQSNSYAKFTPRAVARIMHGISSPAFPSATWTKSHFWGRYVEIDFPVVMEAAKLELITFVGKVG